MAVWQSVALKFQGQHRLLIGNKEKVRRAQADNRFIACSNITISTIPLHAPTLHEITTSPAHERPSPPLKIKVKSTNHISKPLITR